MKALLAAQRPAVLADLQTALVAIDREAEFVSTRTLNAVWALLRDDKTYDLVLLAVDEADRAGLVEVAGARGEFPQVPVVVVSPGASCGPPLAALMGVAAGRLVGQEHRLSDPEGNVEGLRWGYVPTAHASLLSLGLTTRQVEVLTLLLEGSSNKVIARTLDLSVDTVKDHVTALLRNLGVHSRTQAVLAVTGFLARGGEAPRPPRSLPPRPARVQAGSSGIPSRDT